jgi:5-methylcytosine-specific restriction enzyme A
MDFPKIERANRIREFDSYSSVLKAKVVYNYLFKGLSHRALDKNVIGLDPVKSKGWQSMGILHFLGLVNTHKNYFKGISIQKAINELLKINSVDSDLIVTHLKKYVDNSILDKESFEREFHREVAKSLQDNNNTRKKRINNRIDDTPQQVEVISIAFKRNADVVASTLVRANGCCELCKQKAPFIRAKDNTPYLEVHHKIRLADGGKDNLENALALCPNCHRKAHFGKK